MSAGDRLPALMMAGEKGILNMQKKYFVGTTPGGRTFVGHDTYIPYSLKNAQVITKSEYQKYREDGACSWGEENTRRKMIGLPVMH